MTTRQSGAALMEFALAWPLVLLLVLGGVEVAVWSAEVFAVRSAALAGARAATNAGGSPSAASSVALRSLSASLVGTSASQWCPGGEAAEPAVWVCATDLGLEMRVEIGGSVPALVPTMRGAGLPVHARATLQKEEFQR
jgi:hypothetical protein